MKKPALIILLVAFCGMTEAQVLFKGEKSIILSEFIYQKEDVRFPSCHASTIAEIPGGLIAAWFGGTAERDPDVGIWVSRFKNGKWSQPAEAANGIREGRRYPCWNPVLFNSGNEVLLFFKVGPSPSEWWGELITSDDDGISWSASKKLPEGIAGPIKNKPVRLSNGILLCPSSTEDHGWRIHMEMTPNNGITWKRTEALNDRSLDAIQPSVLLHPGGKLQMVCRSKQGKILTAWSMAAVLLENDVKETEYSYPAIIQSDDNKIHITYTWNRKLIKHVIIDPSLIESKSFINGSWPLN